MEDASRPITFNDNDEDEGENKEEKKENEGAKVLMKTRLDNRIIDLRTPAK